ncbi:MAG: hypothetical protein ACHQ9S_24245 [Candidatus Binatia bacterium]
MPTAYAELSTGKKAAHTKKWRAAADKAHATGRNAKTFAKYALGKAGWRVVSFDTRSGYEYKGIVDLVAIKRNNRAPDELTVMLVQVKGGTARVTPLELKRLRAATKLVDVDWNVVHKPARHVRFKRSIS